jgi:hypothetical protein
MMLNAALQIMITACGSRYGSFNEWLKDTSILKMNQIGLS